MFTHLKPKTEEEIDEALAKLPFDKLLSVCIEKNIKRVAKIVRESDYDVTAGNNLLIQWAASNNDAELMKYLLEDGRADPAAGGNYARFIANHMGYTKIEQMLAEDKRTENWLGDNTYEVEGGVITIPRDLIEKERRFRRD